MRNTFLPAVMLLTLPFLGAQGPDKFTNLQVLPKDISKQDLMQIMRGFSFSLKARCETCHAQKIPGDHQSIDYADDSKDTKKIARQMIRMTEALNRDYVSKLEPATSTRVNCATCHHGLVKPRTLQAALSEELEKKDLASALALYKKLRENDYGSGQYDFSEESLNQLSESLLAARKTKEAAAFMELNAENTTMTGWGRSLIAMSHQANGETEKAIADYQKIVDANPNDAWAKKQLETLKSEKK